MSLRFSIPATTIVCLLTSPALWAQADFAQALEGIQHEWAAANYAGYLLGALCAAACPADAITLAPKPGMEAWLTTFTVIGM